MGCSGKVSAKALTSGCRRDSLLTARKIEWTIPVCRQAVHLRAAALTRCSNRHHGGGMLSVRPGLLRALVLPAALVAAFALPRSATAQTTTGSISGNVADPQGQVVPGATVTVIHEGTKEVRVTNSDTERGTFQVTSLAPGTYTVRVELEGFSALERTGVVVSSSDRVSVGTRRLAVGGLKDTVTVQ